MRKGNRPTTQNRDHFFAIFGGSSFIADRRRRSLTGFASNHQSLSVEVSTHERMSRIRH
jgi:hypothetical protein